MMDVQLQVLFDYSEWLMQRAATACLPMPDLSNPLLRIGVLIAVVN
jgi:hypothetical protein